MTNNINNNFRNPLSDKLDSLANPFLDDFVNFSNKFDKKNPDRTFTQRTLSNLSFFDGISKIGDTIEENDAYGTRYSSTGQEVAKFTLSQTTGVVLGGAALFAVGVTLGPVGLLAGAIGYAGGVKLGQHTFDYVQDKFDSFTNL
jgi:hypothetical protein